MPAEQMIYSDGAVSVSTSRVVIHGVTYALRNIASVRAHYTPAKRGCGISLILAALVLCAAGFQDRDKNTAAGIVATLLFIGLPGLMWAALAKRRYHLFFATNAGEIQALSSTDSKYIVAVMEAINHAIVHQ